MRIGIDISSIIYGTGVSVYTQNLIDSLLKLDRSNNYLLFGSSLRRKKELQNYTQKIIAGNRQVTARLLSLPPTLLDQIWNRWHILPIENLTGPLDVFHASDWTQPPAKKAQGVTTLHDLSFLRWPESVHPQVLEAQERRLSWVKKEATAVICVSEATQKEAIELLNIPKNRTCVIYEGTPKEAIEFASRKKNRNQITELKRRLKITKPYLYAYGSQSPRKNIPRVIEAFAEVKKEFDCQLVISGEYRSEKGLPSGVVLTGFLPREQMLDLLSGAEALVFPSIYEGFGLIILEAFVLGVPVVTSNISSMPEVAGKAAVLVNPLLVKEIARGIEKALEDKDKLVVAGLKQAKKFTWEKAARETLTVYEKVTHLP